ncbi:MAG: type I restriction endonuclease subunit M [Alcanivorax sp.]|nr:type I restriction endonuclease subunit M [Alcanivorax sp.]
MFEQTFRNIDDVLWKEAGCATELDYTEQTSWMLFLKYLDDLEYERAQEAELMGKPYRFVIDEPYRWSAWAAPKTASGEFDHDQALTGADLITFVNGELFPYLQGFRERASDIDTLEYRIGEIFSEIRNKFASGYSLRDALELIDGLSFRSQAEKHELSHLYEAKIKNMGNAGRNGGEYYTPRPLIRAMIQVTRPVIGERIYDAAAGSAGFLCEAYDYLRHGGDGKGDGNHLSTADLDTLQKRTFYAKEKKSLPYVIGIMNMILHGIETPNIVHTNSLTENLADIQEKDRFDVILANPPFGGKERKEVQQNFPIKTGETAFLFLQHFIKYLKAGGRAAIVIKNTFLSNSDNASRALRRELLDSCNLHTILDCPGGTFLGAGVKTVVLFFEKGAPTRNIWYYQLDPGRSLGKTNPLNDNDLADFVARQADFEDSDNSWSVDVAYIDADSVDLSVKNPNKAEAEPLRAPEVIINEIERLDRESEEILEGIRGML